MITLPGLIDAHVHLRTPGQTHKEDLATGTRASLAGGFTMVLDMPNTTPPIVDEGTLDDKMRQIEALARCDVRQFLGGTAENVRSARLLAGRAVGLKLYLGQTHGSLFLPHPETTAAHLHHWPGIVAVHADGWHLAAAIGLARLFDRPLHCCHISRKAEIVLIRQAKERGAKITCEATPHHLFLTADDERALGPLGYMKPTLATAADRDALWDNLDVIDCVASDHAPHTLEEKKGDDPPPGVPGLETTLPLMLTAVHEGRLTLDRMVALLVDGPRRIYGLPAQPATYIEIDPRERHVLGETQLYTKCGWTPFAGRTAYGRLKKVVLRGQEVYRDQAFTLF
jgi:dihydroorotase